MKAFALTVVMAAVLLTSSAVSAKDVYAATHVNGTVSWNYYVRTETIRLISRDNDSWSVTVVGVSTKQETTFAVYKFWKYNGSTMCRIFYKMDNSQSEAFKVSKKDTTLKGRIALFARGIIAIHEHKF